MPRTTRPRLNWQPASKSVMNDADIRARLADAALYRRDRQAWAQQAAPRWLKRMKAEDEAEKQESWRVAGPELRAAIRRVIEQEDR